MDRRIFFDSQIWLLEVPKESMEELQLRFRFYNLLSDAYCCFQINKKVICFGVDNNDSQNNGGIISKIYINACIYVLYSHL